MKRHGWTRISPKPGTCWTHWAHQDSGWQFRHCGHPTANWPYYFIDPASLRTVMSFNGLGFKSVEVCMNVIEGVISGTFKLTDDQCVDGIMRVMVTSFGKEIEP